MFEYKIYTPEECPEELFRFRYKIYVEEMHRMQFYACHKTKTIIDPLDRYAHQVVAHRNGEIVGCIRANLLRRGPVGDYLDFYNLDKMAPAKRQNASICTRLMVSKEQRRTSVSIDIFKHLYEFGLAHNIETSHMDCNRHLIGFFEKFGYEFLYRTQHDEYGDVAVLRLFLEDYERLIEMNSPFAETARRRFVEIGAIAELA